MARQCRKIEEGHENWPAPWRQWRQAHLRKPDTEGDCFEVLRPISVGAIVYRAYSTARVTDMWEWLAENAPQEALRER